jgi:hypothetical protein
MIVAGKLSQPSGVFAGLGAPRYLSSAIFALVFQAGGFERLFFSQPVGR